MTSTNPKHWTSEQKFEAAKIFARETAAGATQDRACRVIADALGRTHMAVTTRLQRFGPSFTGKDRYERTPAKAEQQRAICPNDHRVVPADIDPHALAERDRRINLVPVSVTALLMGDPPVGYSMLERRSNKNEG